MVHKEISDLILFQDENSLDKQIANTDLLDYNVVEDKYNYNVPEKITFTYEFYLDVYEKRINSEKLGDKLFLTVVTAYSALTGYLLSIPLIANALSDLPATIDIGGTLLLSCIPGILTGAIGSRLVLKNLNNEKNIQKKTDELENDLRYYNNKYIPQILGEQNEK